MKTYDQAPQKVHDRVNALIKRYHPDLEKVGLRVDLLMASTDNEDAHAVTLNGYPCIAVVKILGPKERAMERGDAEIVIDRDAYEGMDDEERDALLDHELYHLEITLDKYGKPKVDDHQRPKLKMRKHDRQFGWFDEIARRHGEYSIEISQAKAFVDEAGQLYLDLSGDTRSPKHRELDRRLKAIFPAGADSVTISSGGKDVVIDKAGVRPIAA